MLSVSGEVQLGCEGLSAAGAGVPELFVNRRVVIRTRTVGRKRLRAALLARVRLALCVFRVAVTRELLVCSKYLAALACKRPNPAVDNPDMSFEGVVVLEYSSTDCALKGRRICSLHIQNSFSLFSQ